MKVATCPHIPLLRESSARSGFFESAQLASVLAHLPAEIQPVIRFAAITGWRIASEVLPLEWRQVDFAAGEVRLDAGTTKNGDGRVFPMTAALRKVLKAQPDHL
jgi:integrase